MAMGRRLAGMVQAAHRSFGAAGGGEEVENRPQPPDLPAEHDLSIALTAIRKRYVVGPVSTDILHGVNLEVPRGDLLAIMGASGCGKSTLMNIMGLMDRPSGGSCVIGGREVSAMTDDERSEHRNRSIGFVFQSSFLLPRLSAWENVALPLAYRGHATAAARLKAEEMLARVGMEARTEHLPNQLSGGQQQRVAIARALIGRPSIILADEPTGALDAQTAEEIMGLFISLNADDGVTAVVITHDAQVARQCGRVVRLVDGVILESPELSSPAAPRDAD